MQIEYDWAALPAYDALQPADKAAIDRVIEAFRLDESGANAVQLAERPSSPGITYVLRAGQDLRVFLHSDGPSNQIFKVTSIARHSALSSFKNGRG